MRIAIIGHKRIPSNEGGIEKGVEQHAKRMVELGHEVHVYNRGNKHVFEKNYQKCKEYQGIKIVTIPTTNRQTEVPIYSFLATLRALFGGYDVISYRASGSCVMIPIAKLFGNRCIASLHGIDSEREKWGKFASWYLKLGEKNAAKFSDECLVLSQNMKNYIDSKYGIDSIVFANGIERPKKVDLNTMKKFGLEKGNYILFLGRVVPEKGIHYLIKAFKNTKTNKKLVIAGGATNLDYLEYLKQLSDGDNRVIFTGHMKGKQVQELYSNPYMFVLPSDLEGMANALLEAMSYGNCCLISNIPENTQVVGEYAWSFEQGNENDLQDKLQYLIDHEDEVEKTRKATDTHVLTKYSWDKVVEQMLDIYKGNIKKYDDYYKG